MSLQYDPAKVAIDPNGQIHYDGVAVAPDLQTFLNNANNIFPPINQNTRSTLAPTNNDPWVVPRPHHESSPSDSNQKESSSDSANSTAFAPTSGGVSGSSPNSPFEKALNAAANMLAGTDLHRIPATNSVRVRATPGKLIADQKLGPDEFYRDVARRTYGSRNLPQITGKRKQLGVAPDEIVSSGSLQCVPCRPSDLDAKILKIFRIENFNDTPADVYNALQPALKLATRLMTDSRLLPFWATLAVGEREFDNSIASGHFRSRSERLSRRVNLTPDVENAAWWAIDRLGDHIHFSWNDMETYANDTFTFGQKVNTEQGLWHPCNGRKNIHLGFWQSSRSTDPWEQESILQLSRDFFTTAKRIACLQNPETAMVLRFHFFFAVNVCHEVAHAFERKCGLRWFHGVLKGENAIDLSNPNWTSVPSERCQEAAWLQNKTVEMGIAWERDTFGGRIMPVNVRVDASLGIMVASGESDWGSSKDLADAGLPQAHMIPMAFMEEIQQQSFWDRPSDPNELHKVLHIPRTGAVAHSNIQTNPSGWRSWLNQRDTSSLVFADALVDALSADNDAAGSSKRHKADPDSSDRPKKVLPGRGTLLRSGRRLQLRIDKAMSKQEQNLEQMRKDAMASLAEEQAAVAERIRQSQRYVPPPPDQRDLHETLHYHGDDPDAPKSSSGSDSDADPARKPPRKLTVEEKWRLCEEYFMITKIAGIESSSDFLAMRTLARTGWIPLHQHPEASGSWSQRELNVLLNMRKTYHNGEVFQDQQKQKRAKEAEQRRLMVIWQEMEELAVRSGLSRIEFHKARAAGGPLPLNMSVDTWEKDSKWRETLQSMRQTEKFMETPEYQKLLHIGQVLPAAEGAAAMLSRLRSWKPRSSDSQIPEDSKQKKITGYFPLQDEKRKGKAAVQEQDDSYEEWKPSVQEGNSDSSGSDSVEIS